MAATWKAEEQMKYPQIQVKQAQSRSQEEYALLGVGHVEPISHLTPMKLNMVSTEPVWCLLELTEKAVVREVATSVAPRNRRARRPGA